MTVIAINNTIPVLASRPVRWALREGMQPVSETFDVTPDGASALERLAPGPVTLNFSIDNDRIDFENLYIVDFPPGPNPFIRSVRLVDRRFWWPYAHVFRRFNIRRRVGIRRVLQPNVPEALQPLTDDIAFKPFSMLNPEQGFAGRWGGRAAILDVFKEVLGVEANRFGRRARVLFRGVNEFEPVPIENLELDDDGAGSVRRLLDYFPEAKVFVDANGDVVIYSRASGEDRQIVQDAGAEILDRGHVEIVDEKFRRPREVHVLFTRELEVRLDYRSSGVGPNTNVSRTFVASAQHNIVPRVSGGTGILLENVMPLPDYKLNVAGEDYVQGEWVAIDDELMDAWGAPPDGNKITDVIIRRQMVPFVEALYNRTLRLGQFDTTAFWPPRVAALRQHYRRTYRIHRRLLDRVSSIRAYRVATINVQTADRAPAVAYGDWSVIPTVKYFFKGNREATAYVINHSSFRAGSMAIVPGAGATPGTQAMPAEVTVVDEDQGIIRLEFRTDPYHTVEQIIPGQIVNVPKGDPTMTRSVNQAFNAQVDGVDPVTMDSDFRLSVILTVTPGAPNSDEQLHRIIVRPGQIANLIPQAARFGQALGPPMEVRVGPGVETARIVWSDNLADVIMAAAFGFGERGIGAPDISTLVVNADAPANIWQPRFGASLNAIAAAEAARIYSSFPDRFQGTMATRINGRVHPGGALAEVTFQVEPTGEATTELSLPSSIEPIDFLNFLNDSTRAILLRVAMPG